MKANRTAYGFSLIEVLLALGVAGFVLTAASFYVVSLASIWMNRGNNDFFDQHVDGVALFLNNAFSQSEGIEGNEKEPVVWSRPPGFSEFDKPLLTFRLRRAPALLVWEDRPLSTVTCYLHFDEREGLSLLWHSRLQETEDLNDVYRTRVSPFVKKIQYSYYDEEDNSWESSESPAEDRDGQFLLPEFILLAFENEGDVREMPVYLPSRTQNVPLF